MNRIDHETPDRIFYWQHPRFPDLGLLRARFRRHRYALHTHSTYVVALITDGCERLRVGRGRNDVPSGSVIVVNPEECHDGEAGCPEGWAYRTLYPTVALMAELARELGVAAPPLFPRAVITDPRLASALAVAHRAAEPGRDDDAEAAMLVALRRLILDHADRCAAPLAGQRGAARRVALYRAMLEADLASPLALAGLAAAAGVTRFQVIRDFRAGTGLTPGAFLRDRRVRQAAVRIAGGEGLAQAAAATGFADQSHLTRAFRQAHGFTPGVLRAAFRQPR